MSNLIELSKFEKGICIFSYPAMSYAIEQFYRLFQGALVFQGIFFGIIFFLTKRNDIMWYVLYLLAAAAYFFINASGTFFNIDENLVFESAWYNWINIPLIIAENLFYLLFIRHFFKDIISNPQVGKVLQITLQSIPLLITVFLLLKIVNANTQLILYSQPAEYTSCYFDCYYCN